MVEINNRIDPCCKLFMNGEYVGTIRNNTALLDVLAQIAESNEEGYTIRYKRKNYRIGTDGRVKDAPEGFYDATTKALCRIMHCGL